MPVFDVYMDVAQTVPTGLLFVRNPDYLILPDFAVNLIFYVSLDFPFGYPITAYKGL